MLPYFSLKNPIVKVLIFPFYRWGRWDPESSVVTYSRTAQLVSSGAGILILVWRQSYSLCITFSSPSQAEGHFCPLGLFFSQCFHYISLQLYCLAIKTQAKSLSKVLTECKLSGQNIFLCWVEIIEPSAKGVKRKVWGFCWGCLFCFSLLNLHESNVFEFTLFFCFPWSICTCVRRKKGCCRRAWSKGPFLKLFWTEISLLKTSYAIFSFLVC